MILKIVMWAIIAGLIFLIIKTKRSINKGISKHIDQLVEEYISLEDEYLIFDGPTEIEVTADKLVVDQPNNIMKMEFTLYRPRVGFDPVVFNPIIDKREILLMTPYNNFNPGSGEDLQQAQISILKDLMKKNGYSTTMTYQEFQNFDLKEEENMKIGII